MPIGNGTYLYIEKSTNGNYYYMKYSQKGQKCGGRDTHFQRETLKIANNVTKLGSGKRYKIGKYTSTVFLVWEQQKVVFHYHVDNSVSVCMCECVFDKYTIIDRSNDIIHIKLLSYSCISYMFWVMLSFRLHNT